MSTTNLPHNRWAALLEDNLDAAQVHRLIAESVAEREAALLQDPGSASAHSTPATDMRSLGSGVSSGEVAFTHAILPPHLVLLATPQKNSSPSCPGTHE